MDFGPAGGGRMLVALLVLAGLAAASWSTMLPGKPRYLTMVLLGFFAFRVLLGRMGSRRSSR